jgi:hypothetical protein
MGWTGRCPSGCERDFALVKAQGKKEAPPSGETSGAKTQACVCNLPTGRRDDILHGIGSGVLKRRGPAGGPAGLPRFDGAPPLLPERTQYVRVPLRAVAAGGGGACPRAARKLLVRW